MKAELRKKMMHLRKQVSQEALEEKSRKIYARLIQSDLYKNSNCIMLYMDYKKEVQTGLMIQRALEDQKKVILPIVDFDKKTLILTQIFDLQEDMILSKYGILEPILNEERICSIDQVDLILSPGLAFDMNGYRLGYGGGYYDKLLASSTRPDLKVIALAFELQLVEKVPHESFDKKINGIFTEDRLLEFN